jgi:hypothetical protein
MRAIRSVHDVTTQLSYRDMKCLFLACCCGFSGLRTPLIEDYVVRIGDVNVGVTENRLQRVGNSVHCIRGRVRVDTGRGGRT